MMGGRLPPAGRALGWGRLRRITTRRTSSEQLARRLAQRLGADRVLLSNSGRESMRRALEWAAAATGRDEVVLPAYTCFSVAASAVAAGLRVRLVDVDEVGRLDAEGLRRIPLERVAAIVVCNLFGRAEPVAALESMARQAGVWLVDDGAQAFGASSAEEPSRLAGGRGDLGVLSFGRGKPLSGLGGGAWALRAGVDGPAAEGDADQARGGVPALFKAVAYDVALQPLVFGGLARIPALGIGETHYDPDFEGGRMDSVSVTLTDVALDDAANDADARELVASRLADDLGHRTRLLPIVAEPGERAVHPRLAVLAPDEATRSDVLGVCARAGAGATSLYPSALSRLEPLRPHLVVHEPMPEAERLAGRILTLPVHGGLRGPRWQAVLSQIAAR